MAIQLSAKADTTGAHKHIICTEKHSGQFNIQLKVGSEISNGDFLAPEVYAAEFTSLQGPDLAGIKYDVEVLKSTISTRLKAGYSYAAQIPDGSQLYIENSFYDTGAGQEVTIFIAKLSNWHNKNLSFNC